MVHEIPYIDLKKQHAGIKDEILRSVCSVLERGDFILGQEVSQLEREFAEYCGTKFAVGVNSGTDALFLCLKAYGIGPGDEVITAPNSFLATASVIAASGARPVFVDVREDLNINPELIKEKITANTKAIIPVHLTGRPADMKRILEVSIRHNLLVIEDAAQAVGAEYNNKKVGSFGNAGCFSMHPLKTLNACGDAGMITTNDEKLFLKLIQLRNIGLKNRDESDIWGYNSRLDTIQAAIILVKMKYLEKWTEMRRQNAQFYMRELKGIVKIPEESKETRSVFHTFVIQAEDRDKLKEYLAKRKIGTRIHYPIPIHMQKASQSFGYKKGDFPLCERLSETMLSLPVYQGLIEEDISYICQAIHAFFSARNKD